MKGFSEQWGDLPDYILGITKEIWEGRGLATLNHYYAENIPMRFPEGVSIGNQRTINGTLSTLAEFPDRELTGEDVIWSGNEQDGFLSSHRLLTMGTHTGGGYFGPPTGKRFVIRAIADCAAINNQINDEWLIRDTAGLVLQLGLDPKEFARDLIVREGGAERCVTPFSPAIVHQMSLDIDHRGRYRGPQQRANRIASIESPSSCATEAVGRAKLAGPMRRTRPHRRFRSRTTPCRHTGGRESTYGRWRHTWWEGFD